MPSIEERVKEIIADIIGVGIEQVTPEASFVDDLDADSLDQAELFLALEEEFECTVSAEQAFSIRTVKEAIDFITNLEASGT